MPSMTPSVVGSRHLKNMVFEESYRFFIIVLELMSQFLLFFINYQDMGTQRRSNASARQASLNRFREKRKERCFAKKIRYDVRKDVALRYICGYFVLLLQLLSCLALLQQMQHAFKQKPIQFYYYYYGFLLRTSLLIIYCMQMHY